jgi:hypothetical protein
MPMIADMKLQQLAIIADTCTAFEASQASSALAPLYNMKNKLIKSVKNTNGGKAKYTILVLLFLLSTICLLPKNIVAANAEDIKGDVNQEIIIGTTPFTYGNSSVSFTQITALLPPHTNVKPMTEPMIECVVDTAYPYRDAKDTHKDADKREHSIPYAYISEAPVKTSDFAMELDMVFETSPPNVMAPRNSRHAAMQQA